MWIAKILYITSKNTSGLQTPEYIENDHLRNVYTAGMISAKASYGPALVAIYKGLSLPQVEKDDPPELNTRAEYIISKGSLGGVDVWCRNHTKKLHKIKENDLEEKFVISRNDILIVEKLKLKG